MSTVRKPAQMRRRGSEGAQTTNPAVTHLRDRWTAPAARDVDV